jgi:hypothetical protein
MPTVVVATTKIVGGDCGNLLTGRRGKHTHNNAQLLLLCRKQWSRLLVVKRAVKTTLLHMPPRLAGSQRDVQVAEGHNTSGVCVCVCARARAHTHTLCSDGPTTKQRKATDQDEHTSTAARARHNPTHELAMQKRLGHTSQETRRRRECCTRAGRVSVGL